MADRDGRSVCIHRGLFGQSLKRQCYIIGGNYLGISAICVVLASLMLHSPMKYVSLDKLSVDSTKEGVLSNPNATMLTDVNSSDSTMDQIDRLTAIALHGIGTTATEFLVEGLSTFVVSALLLHGLREEKTSFIFPWVIVTILMTIANFFAFIMNVASPGSVSVLKIFGAVTYFAIATYFILSVFSYHQILRIKKRKVTSFLDHEFQGGVGANYHSLEEDGNSAHMYRDIPTTTVSHPWGRPAPYVEKTVPMTEEEDVGKENVLFAKV